MNKEVIYLDESGRKKAVKPQPLTMEEFVGVSGDLTSKENIEKYVNYRIDFEHNMKKVKLKSNKAIYEFNEIVYLGKSYTEDTFACKNDTHWELLFGELNSGLY